jgi:hypothetical protein
MPNFAALNVGAADAGEQARAWLAALLAAHTGEAPFRLAVGGPRESEAKGIYGKARVVLENALKWMASQ